MFQLHSTPPKKSETTLIINNKSCIYQVFLWCENSSNSQITSAVQKFFFASHFSSFVPMCKPRVNFKQLVNSIVLLTTKNFLLIQLEVHSLEKWCYHSDIKFKRPRASDLFRTSVRAKIYFVILQFLFNH